MKFKSDKQRKKVMSDLNRGNCGTGRKNEGIDDYFKIDKNVPVGCAKEIGNEIGIDWKKRSLNQFHKGLVVELEHGTIDKQTNITDDDGIMTGKISLIHQKERDEYYDELERMEKGKCKK